MELSHVRWRTSSYSGSNGSCVEVGVWRKASYSGSNGDCVEVGAAARVVAVRDSKNPAGAALSFGPAAWQAFTCRIKQGRADRA
jgi:hypothetical protein